MTAGARLALGGIIAIAIALAVAGARPYAGGWNDGSRLATAESLVDFGTWTIDRSIFVEPARRPAGAPPPYLPDDRLLMERGTLDRLFVDGRFITDKTPVSALLLAAEYWIVQRASGVVARVRPDRYCYWMTLASAGLSYLVAVGAIGLLAWRVTRSESSTVMLAASFAFATTAAAYSRHVNAHEMLLGALALLMLELDAMLRDGPRAAPLRLAAIGTLAGIAYGLDAAIGPLVVVLTIALAFRLVGWRAIGVALAAAPWVIAEHWLNVAIGHTVLPLNSVPAYLAWPGSPFDATTMSGRYAHRTPWHAAVYAIDLLAGRRGFLLHDLPLLLLPFAAWHVVRAGRHLREWPVALFAVALCVTTWIVYAVGSTNHSGEALSIRWFVPLLAPAFYLLAIDVRDTATAKAQVIALGIAGAGLGLSAWTRGPWEPRVPLFWAWIAVSLGGLIVASFELGTKGLATKTRKHETT